MKNFKFPCLKTDLSTLLFVLCLVFPAALNASTRANVESSIPPPFVLQTTQQTNDLSLHWKLEEGILLYPQKIEFLDAQKKKLNLDFDQTTLPSKVEGCFSLAIPYASFKGLKLQNKAIPLWVKSPICEKTGLCLQPVFSPLPLPDHLCSQQSDPTPAIHDFLDHQNLIGLFAFMGLGVLLAFTPCVLPMIPIITQVMTSSNKGANKFQAVPLMGVYVLSLAFCYALMGYVTVRLGFSLQLQIQTPAVLLPTAFLVFLCALHQFGLLHFNLPFSTPLRFWSKRSALPKSAVLNAAAQGALSAFIASPCVTPALVGTLAYISQTGRVGLGSLNLFCMALGLGLPFLGVAALGTKWLPKTGPWMVKIKYLSGLLLLLLSAWLIRSFIPQWLAYFTPEQTPSKHWITLQDLKQLAELEKKLNENQRLAVIKVTADWCPNCLRLDHYFQTSSLFQSKLSAVWINLNLSENTAAKREIIKTFEIFGPPALLCYSAQHRVWQKLIAETSPDQVDQFLSRCQNPF